MPIGIDASAIGGYLFPLFKTIFFLAIGIGSVGGFAYYLLVVKRRRVWNVNIWEKKADGTLQMITKDKLTEKKINKGKQLIYKLKRQKHECFPPPWECVYRVRGKEYCDYLRVAEEYLPLRQSLGEMNNMVNNRKGIIEKVKENLSFIKTHKKKDIEEKFVFVPLSQAMTATIKFEPMEYDVNMMRINAIDIRDKIYMDKQDFLQKYGTFVAFGLIVVLIIVVLYLSYEYSGNVISQGMGKAQETLSMVEQLAQQMGGTTPVQ